MGLSVAISGGIILTTLFIAVFALSGITDTILTMGDASTQSSQIEKKIFDTQISMNHVTSESGSPTLNFTLSNDGQEKLWNFDEFNLMVTYDGTTSGRLTEELSYNGDCGGGIPASGNWCIESIDDDMLDPGILNSAEGANIRSRVNENLANANAVVSITTDNGITDTVTSPYCGINCRQIIWSPIGPDNDAGVGFTWDNLGAAIEAIDDSDYYDGFLDLSEMEEWRLVINVRSGESAACVIGFQFSTDGGATWRGLDNGNAGSLSTTTVSCDNTGDFVTEWSSLHSDAISDVKVRFAGDGSGAADDPTVGIMEIQFRS